MTGIEWMTLYGLLIGTGVAGTVALCFYIIYKRLANGNRWKRTTFLPATRIKISGNPLDTDANIKLLHQQPRLGGSGTMGSELKPLMRHTTFRDSGRVERMRCNTSTGQHLITTSPKDAGIRPLSQSAQYLARSSPTPTTGVLQNVSADSQVGSGYDIRQQVLDKELPQVELTLVYVSVSAQLLVHIHRLSNVPTGRYGKESATYVKVVLTGRVRRSYRSALADKSQQPCAQVFKFSDVTTKDLLDGDLMTSIYFGRGRWRTGKKIGSWRLHLSDITLADGVPRSCLGLLRQADGRKDAEEMTGAVEMGQLLIALQHQENITDAGPSRLLKILIGRAEGLSSTKSVFEPEYIVVVNAHYPDGRYETKETYSAKGKVPNWNQTIEFDVTNRPIESCSLHLTVVRKLKMGQGSKMTVGHLRLGANSTPDGERYWQRIVNPNDSEITQWHRLTAC